MKKAIFYHAGCPICVSAEQQVLAALDSKHCDIKVVHLGQDQNQIAVAEQAGVKSVPALVLEGNVFHINFGASLEDLKGVSDV
ncbi:MAG: thioredoxin family protein [Pseudomonadales bacterium]|nr:thioredoxin family protein [Pseudomonadales bacterium]MCP5213767.1 thioredoxin family protein [Pseudomonadales bacterium]